MIFFYVSGKIEELDRDVKKTAKINKTVYPSDIFDAKHEIQENKDLFAGKATLFDLFRPMTICGRTLVMFYNWLVKTLRLKNKLSKKNQIFSQTSFSHHKIYFFRHFIYI